MKIHLGMNLLYAAKRWIEPEIWGQQIGERWHLRHAQFCFDLLDPRSTMAAKVEYCEEVKKAAKKYNFTVHSSLTGSGTFWYLLLMHPFSEGRKDAWHWCELAAETSEMLGARSLGGPIAAASVTDYADAKRFEFLMEEFVKGMNHLALHAARHGQEFIFFEPSTLGREGLVHLDQAKKLVERLNNNTPIPIHLMLDVGHQCGAESRGINRDPYKWLEELGQFSPIIHIQQTDGEADHHWSFTKEHNASGIIKIDKVLNSLEKSGLQEVWIFPEFFYGTDFNDSRILEEIDESFEHIKAYIK